MNRKMATSFEEPNKCDFCDKEHFAWCPNHQKYVCEHHFKSHACPTLRKSDAAAVPQLMEGVSTNDEYCRSDSEIKSERETPMDLNDQKVKEDELPIQIDDSSFVTKEDLRKILENYATKEDVSKLKRQIRSSCSAVPGQSSCSAVPGQSSCSTTSNPDLVHGETSSEPLYNGYKLAEIKKAVATGRDLFESTDQAMNLLFSKEEILTKSVTGQKSNKKTPAKDRFDSTRYDLLVELLKEKYPSVGDTEITKKVHSVIKKAKREVEKEKSEEK